MTNGGMRLGWMVPYQKVQKFISSPFLVGINPLVTSGLVQVGCRLQAHSGRRASQSWYDRSETGKQGGRDRGVQDPPGTGQGEMASKLLNLIYD